MKQTYYKMIIVFCGVILTGITGADLFAAQAPPFSDNSQATPIPQWPDVRSLEPRLVLQHDDYQNSIHLWTDKVEPHPPIAGEQYRVLILYRYQSCPPMTSSFSIKVELDNSLFEERLVNWYEAPNCQHGMVGDLLTNKYWTATPGNHTLKVTLDSKNDITEGPVNELNNILSITFNVPFPRKDIKPPVEKNINPVIPRTR